MSHCRALDNVIVALLASLLCACSTLPNYRSEVLSADRLEQTRRILVVPPEVQMFEVSAGGVPERVKGWGEQAAAAVRASLVETLGRGRIELVDLPALDAGEQEQVDRHLAMFRRLGEAISSIEDSHDPVWKKRRDQLDFTIGDGLAELGRRFEADGFMFVDGVDFISTTGRRLIFALSTLAFGIPVVPLGTSYLQAGIVEAKSGQVLWFGRDYRFAAGDLREAETAQRLTAQVFAGYFARTTESAGE